MTVPHVWQTPQNTQVAPWHQASGNFEFSVRIVSPVPMNTGRREGVLDSNSISGPPLLQCTMQLSITIKGFKSFFIQNLVTLLIEIQKGSNLFKIMRIHQIFVPMCNEAPLLKRQSVV